MIRKRFIRQAFKSRVSDDSTAYPRGQATYNGKPTDYMRLTTYGHFGNAPEGAYLILLSSQGQEAVKLGIECPTTGRFKNVAEGECGLYNELTGAFIHLKENGDIDVSTDADVNVTANNINATATGDITTTATLHTVNGPIEASLTITAAGKITCADLVVPGSPDYTAHVHADPVSGNTGPPI